MKKLIARVLSAPFLLYYKLRYFGRVKFGSGVIVNHRFKFSGKGRLKIGHGANLWAHKEWNEFFTYNPSAEIVIGERTRLNGIGVQCRKKVKIGDDCLVGSALLMDNDFHSLDHENRNDPAKIGTSEIVVGDHVWIAGQTVVLKGVEVGSRSVIAIRAVVTKDVSEDCVVAGNPAKVVKELKN